MTFREWLDLPSEEGVRLCIDALGRCTGLEFKQHTCAVFVSDCGLTASHFPDGWRVTRDSDGRTWNIDAQMRDALEAAK